MDLVVCHIFPTFLRGMKSDETRDPQLNVVELKQNLILLLKIGTFGVDAVTEMLKYDSHHSVKCV